jgi:hypothetical protein
MKTLSLHELCQITGGQARQLGTARPDDKKHIQKIPLASPDEWKRHLLFVGCSSRC